MCSDRGTHQQTLTGGSARTLTRLRQANIRRQQVPWQQDPTTVGEMPTHACLMHYNHEQTYVAIYAYNYA